MLDAWTDEWPGGVDGWIYIRIDGHLLDKCLN